MKTVIAYIRPSKEGEVQSALRELKGVNGASFSDVRGFGRGRSTTRLYEIDDEGLIGTSPKVRVEVMVNDELVASVSAAIAKAAHSGLRGDGKVFVTDLVAALRISSGEIGKSAM